MSPEVQKWTSLDTVQVECKWYSVPATLVRQNVTLQIRDQQLLILQGGVDCGPPFPPGAN